MKLDANVMMDYLEGTLDAARRSEVEAHLAADAEDRELIDIMRASMVALRELDEREPVRASGDFWIKVRDALPANPPKRSLWSQLAGVLWPQPGLSSSRGKTPVRVALAVGAFALMAVWFAPRQTTHIGEANGDLPPEARAFVQMATQRHNAFVSSQPLNGAPLGDRTSVETGDEEDEPGGSNP